MKSLAISTTVVLLLGGCSIPPSDPPSPDPSSPPPASYAPKTPEHRTELEVEQAPSGEDRDILEASRLSAAAPRWFKRRRSLASCGDRAGSLGQPPKTLSGYACLTSAAKGAGAELNVLSRTVEGDPVITYYRVGPQIRHVEVFTDWTLDRFSPKGWARETWSFERLQKELAP